MNKRQKKKLKKRHTPNIITEFIDKTTIDDVLPSRDEILQKIAINFKDCTDNIKSIPDVVFIDKNIYILDEKDKAELYDIIFQKDNKNE